MTRGALILAAATLLAVSAAPAENADYVEYAAFTQTVAVVYSGAMAAVSNGAGAGVAYVQNGANLTFTSTVAGVEFVLSGTSTGGFFKLSNAYPAKLTLNGFSLSSTNNPAIQIRSTNRCFVVSAPDTTNFLADGITYADSVSGALYGGGPLVFSGLGRLTVAGKGTSKHGIYSASYIRMRGGDVAVTSAAKDGIHAVQYFRMDHGTLTIAASGDGVDGDAGYVEINGGALGVNSTVADTKGVKCDGTLTVNGGTLNLAVAGVQSKGLKSGAMAINGGTLVFHLTGGPYLGTNTVVTTNGGVVTTNKYVDPSYCTAIKCDSNLTVNAGFIAVMHTGTAGKGISADGDITINGGIFDLFTSGGNSATFTNDLKVLDTAAADCLKADGTLRILRGTIRAVSTGNAGDAISAEGDAIIGVAGITNTPRIEAVTRGLRVYLYGSGDSAEYSNPKTFSAQGNVTVNGGTFRATTLNNGGEGLESKNILTVNGGDLDITAYDDCLNASSNVTINGGRIYCYSTGNDAIDSNGPMTINGGTIVASGTTAPEEGFDCDQNTFAIRGGTLVGTGGASSSPTAASCTQRSVIYKAAGSSGVVVQVKTSATNLLVYKLPRTYSGGGGGPGGGSASMTMLFSLPALANATYYLVTNAVVSGGTEFHGLLTGATVTGGTTSKTFTASSMVTTVQ